MVRAAAVAYHLALQGYGNEVVLLEQDRYVLICAYIFFRNPEKICSIFIRKLKISWLFSPQNWWRNDLA